MVEKTKLLGRGGSHSGPKEKVRRRARRESDGRVEGPVLLATKGRNEHPSVLSIAQQIALRQGTELRIVSVVPPVLLYGLPPELQGEALTVDRQLLDDRSAEVQLAMQDNTLLGVTWKSEILLGQPAIEVADAAARLHAGIIVVGASPYRRLRHVVAGQRAAQILHRATVPVLTVVPWNRRLPTRVVVGIDFGPSSLHAAETVAPLVQKGAAITLVHVLPPNLIFPGGVEPGDPLRAAVARELESVANKLRKLTPAAIVDTVLLSGNIAAEILDFADRVGADLVAIGTRSQSGLRRLFVGSVATEIFHSALVGVLASPPPPIGHQVRLALDVAGTVTLSNPDDFAEALASFSRSNEGRTATIEEDDPLLGAQVQVSGYALLGTAFDRADKRVNIMLGPVAGGAAHITRTIPNVRSVSVTRVSVDGTIALQLDHGASQTLVIIAPERQ